MRQNATVLLTLLCGGVLAGAVLAGVAVVRLGEPEGKRVIARVEGIPIHRAEFEVGSLFWEESVQVDHLDAELVERYGEDTATLANLVMARAARVAWERLREPGHFVVETDFGSLSSEEIAEQRRAILDGRETAPGSAGRLRAEVQAAGGEEVYFDVVVPNEALDGNARVAFTSMEGLGAFDVSVELARIALDLEIEVDDSFEDRVSEDDLRAYLEEFVEVMPGIIEQQQPQPSD